MLRPPQALPAPSTFSPEKEQREGKRKQEASWGKGLPWGGACPGPKAGTLLLTA